MYSGVSFRIAGFKPPFRYLGMKSAVRTSSGLHSTIASEPYKEGDSPRLKKARLRLSETQGRINIGASELSEDELKNLKVSSAAPSKVREISWKVAEPEVKYDPEAVANRLYNRPSLWIGQNLKIFVPLTIFVGKVLVDIATGKEEAHRPKRANELLGIIGNQSPALIKAGQSLSSRSDLLPSAYLEALQKLQDRCPPYPTSKAMRLYETEMKMKFEDVFELESPEPVAAASIGQVSLPSTSFFSLSFV